MSAAMFAASVSLDARPVPMFAGCSVSDFSVMRYEKQELRSLGLVGIKVMALWCDSLAFIADCTARGRFLWIR
ncbi:MAG: hypothetical protein ACKPJD_03625, partial [Planctomycetaceae bacterium]